ncbi:hypothetical protein DLJ46_12745 [Micromonospora globispora]|uniref:Uncharacterized protein n=1 Tax=Micromonospora globispora TaxID=1450148 RepID=A0A317K6H4_9ACTN|nr:hypothetical protein [Micromonospora globispora]PWU48162.1 hypothetical protein DLJ46_12745 [Micromonospora globispora]
MSGREFHCDVCEGVQLFEAPPCVDGHGVDCPEFVCTGCGAAVLIATFALRTPRLDARRRRPATPGHRRAA